MSDQFSHLRPRAAEDVVGRIDGCDYCEDCGLPFAPTSLSDGLCEVCRRNFDGDSADRPEPAGIAIPAGATRVGTESPSVLPSPGSVTELPFDTADPSSVVLNAGRSAHCLGNGDGILVNRIRNLFHYATRPHQFRRLIRFIRKIKQS